MYFVLPILLFLNSFESFLQFVVWENIHRGGMGDLECNKIKEKYEAEKEFPEGWG